MPDEDWRDEIQEYARLLDAVASGDRSRVVKHLTEYILGKKEGNQASNPNDQPSQGEAEEQEEEEQQHPEKEEDDEDGHEYYGDETYNDSYAGTSAQPADQEEAYTEEDERDLDYEDDQYHYDNGYDEYLPAEYDASEATENYYEGAYMSGAYNEPENAGNTYNGESYDEHAGLDPSTYGNEAYATGETDPAQMSYADGTYDGPDSTSYGVNTYPEGQQYDEEYYDQEADGTYDDWNQGGENYPYQQGMEGAGGEWYQEPDYGLLSDDQNQEVVDETTLNELDEPTLDDLDEATLDESDETILNELEEAELDEPDEESFEEEQTPSYDDHTHSEEQPYPDDDDMPPIYHQEQSQLHQPYPEGPLPFYHKKKYTLPPYSLLPTYETNQTQQTQYVPYRPGLEAPTDKISGEAEIPAKSRSDRTGSEHSADQVDFEEDEWEDAACEEEDESIRSPSSRSDLHLNPFGHQYESGVSARRPNSLFLPKY